MTRGIYTIASGGVAAMARLDAAAQNLANVGTAGYKAERVTFSLRPLVAGPAGVDPVLARTAAQVRHAATVRDFSQGPIRTTGNALDVAVTGAGFFAVQTARGERYTRQGSFDRDAEGYLVTAAGERVLSEQETDIRLGDGAVEIGEDGTIRADGSEVARLRVVTFGDRPPLVPEGRALFAPAPGAVGRALAASETRVVPGAIEGANVDAIRGLVDLVELTRGFESYMKALQRLDETTERSISDVGRVG
jgi:flagellar basal-body rod protein FlgG